MTRVKHSLDTRETLFKRSEMVSYCHAILDRSHNHEIIRTRDPKRQQAYLTIQKELDAEILRSLKSTLNLQETLIIYDYFYLTNNYI